MGAARRSDVICDFPLKEMLAYHKSKGAEGTILVTQARTSACSQGWAFGLGLGVIKSKGAESTILVTQARTDA